MWRLVTSPTESTPESTYSMKKVFLRAFVEDLWLLLVSQGWTLRLRDDNTGKDVSVSVVLGWVNMREQTNYVR